VIRVGVQCRAEVRGRKLGGYASVFNRSADLGWMGSERIAPGAFDEALKTSDPRALWNHDPNYVLGRMSAGTLRLSVDSTGLEYEVDLPDTSYARDLRELVERGDVTGASFAFVPGMHTWDRETETRTHTSVKELVDVSPVAYPAYEGASTEARAEQSALVRKLVRRSQLIRLRAGVLLEGRGK
jgi:HK97 family phage prohead protease